MMILPTNKEAGQQQVESVLRLDELHLQVGYALVPLVDQAQGGQLPQRPDPAVEEDISRSVEDLEPFPPHVVVLAPTESSPGIRVQSLGVVR